MPTRTGLRRQCSGPEGEPRIDRIDQGGLPDSRRSDESGDPYAKTLSETVEPDSSLRAHDVDVIPDARVQVDQLCLVAEVGLVDDQDGVNSTRLDEGKESIDQVWGRSWLAGRDDDEHRVEVRSKNLRRPPPAPPSSQTVPPGLDALDRDLGSLHTHSDAVPDHHATPPRGPLLEPSS